MSEQILSKEEFIRYSRHLIMPEFNIVGQQRLKNSRVLVVGVGGLGAPLLQYLAAAGVGHIGLVDFDVVEDHNLQRQVLFGTSDIGYFKVDAAKNKLLNLNPYIEVEVYNTVLTSDNALDIIRKYDVVADGTDNFPTRYLVNDACILLNKVNVYASIYRFDGQVSVFNYVDPDTGERGPNYRDLYASPPAPGLVPSCAEGGVLGVLPGIIGSLQASEVIKVITGIGDPLSGRLFIFDALSFSTRILKIRRDPVNPINGLVPTQTGLIDYNFFCGISPFEEEEKDELQELTVQEFEEIRLGKLPFQLIDVREPYEYDIVNISGELIPLDKIIDFSGKISRDKKVIVHCRSGERSAKAIRELHRIGLKNIFNLKGGILAYVNEINPKLTLY